MMDLKTLGITGYAFRPFGSTLYLYISIILFWLKEILQGFFMVTLKLMRVMALQTYSVFMLPDLKDEYGIVSIVRKAPASCKALRYNISVQKYSVHFLVPKYSVHFRKGFFTWKRNGLEFDDILIKTCNFCYWTWQECKITTNENLENLGKFYMTLNRKLCEGRF